MITILLLLLPALAQDAEPASDDAPTEEVPASPEEQEAPQSPETPTQETGEPPAGPEAEEEPDPGTSEEPTPETSVEPAPGTTEGEDIREGEVLEEEVGPGDETPTEEPGGEPESPGEVPPPEAETEPKAETEPEQATPLANPLVIDPSEFQQASSTANAIAEGEYETLEGLSGRQVRWLKPKRARLPPNSRSSTDYTAYVLEWGEVEFGPTGLVAGALPRVQVGTVPVLDGLRLFNGWIKVNPVRIGGFDLAVNATAFYLPLKGFKAYLLSGGALASLQILEPWSIHLGGNYSLGRAIGVPDLRGLSPLLSPYTGEELAEYSLQALHDDLYVDVSGQFVSVRFATDYRFNRRDSVIAQAQAMVWASVDSDIDLPPILNMNEALDVQSQGTLPLQDAFVASIAYQAAWRRLTIRAGFGVSSQQGAWLIQSVKLNYRFGGETRREEQRLRGNWRSNKEEKAKKKERQEAADRGVWTPDQEDPPADQDQDQDQDQDEAGENEAEEQPGGTGP